MLVLLVLISIDSSELFARLVSVGFDLLAVAGVAMNGPQWVGPWDAPWPLVPFGRQFQRIARPLPVSHGRLWVVIRGRGPYLTLTRFEAPRTREAWAGMSKTEGINAPADSASHRKWRDDLHRQNRRSRSGDRSPPFWTSWPKFLSPGLDGSGARRTLRNCRSSHAQARRFRGARAGYHGAVPHYWPHYCCGVLFFRICRPDTASPSPPLCSGAFRDRCWRSGLPRRAHRIVALSAPATGVWADRGASQPGAADYAWADTAS